MISPPSIFPASARKLPTYFRVFSEKHRMGDVLSGKPTVHPQTGQTGWDGCPDAYYRSIFEGWKRQLGG